MKTIALLLIILGLSSEVRGQKPYDSCVFVLSRSQVIDELARYSDLWQNDSLAKNGFRRFFGKEVLWCAGNALVGMQFSELSTYLGPPHFRFTRQNDRTLPVAREVLFYVLHAERSYKTYKDIGNIILTVLIENGKVLHVGIGQNDG